MIAGLNHVCQLGLAICTPIPLVPGPLGPRLAMLTTEWHRYRRSIALPTNFADIEIKMDGMEIGEARQAAIDNCMQHDPRPEFLFFLDYDVLPMFDCVTKLVMRARHFPDFDVYSGVYCSKSDPAEPLIYEKDGGGPFWDWEIGDLLLDKIHGCHMGLTLIRMSLFDRFPKEAWERPMFLSVNEQSISPEGVSLVRRGTEDLYFCRRATEEIGLRILVDTSVLAGHIDHRTGRIFGIGGDCKPGKTRWLKRPDGYDQEKKALDLGAGGSRREWPGYKTYTTDIRADTKPDYVMDSRLINIPDGHFDLVASSHHLEHIPRWEQDQVWKEIFRITKPSGTIEHIVPNVAWAASKIVENEEDEHVMNVLYGAQEAHGYERIFNLHYYGYTPAIARAHAEEVGFVDVKTEDFEFDPTLGYNLVIRGRKPIPGEVAAATKAKKSRKKLAASNGRAKSNGKTIKAKQHSAGKRLGRDLHKLSKGKK